MARSRLDDQVGRVVGGRYRLLAPVGTGASADVYVADDVTLRRRVAVKVLHPALAADEGFLRRFRAEARAVASLRHANIMGVFDWGEEEDGPFLVLEYLGGGSLRDLLDRGHRLTPSQAVLVGLEAAHGLDYAHRRGLVHRDVKPANLLFDDEGRLAIADFGIARALAEATWTEPTGAVVGTVRYASPEQARGNSIDGRADVYALALVLIEAVTGTVPFASDTTIATLMGRLDRPIPVPDALGPLVPAIEAAGTVDVTARVDAAGFARALDTAAHQLPRPGRLPLVPLDRLPVPDGSLADRTTAFAPIEPPARVAFPPADPGPAPWAPPPPGPPPPRATDVSVAAAESGRARRRRRRWPWLLATAVLAGVALAAAILVPPVIAPTYLVPDLANQSVAVATARAGPHFHVVVHNERVTGAAVGVVLGQQPAPNTRHRAGVITIDVSEGNVLVPVPGLAGVPLQVALSRLQAARLTGGQPLYNFSPTVASGSVIDWSPKTNAPEQSAINLVVSKGAEFLVMPDFTTKPTPVADAVAALTALGFDAGQITQTQDFNDTVPVGDVVSSNPPAGAQADRALTVALDVSKGPQTVTVPDVRGDTVKQAKAAVKAAGLTVGAVYGPSDGIVFGQKPGAGTVVKHGTAVELGAL